MEGKIAGTRVDELAELIAASEVVNSGLDEVSRIEHPDERAELLQNMTIEAAGLFQVSPATVVRGINKAQRERAISQTARGENGHQT